MLKIFDISYTTNICGGIIIYKVLKAYPFYKDIVKVEKYGNGHINEDDPNTIILKIRLTDGILFSNGLRYEF